MAAGTPAVMTAYGELLARLSSGAFRPGSRLPGERALSVSLGVSRTTLRSSLDLLADEGWLVPSDRRGWYVRSSVVGEPPNTLQSFSEMAAAKGLNARTHILMHRTRTVEFDEANSLQVPLGSDVVELVRLRSLDDVAICHDRSVLPLALVPPLENADLEDRSLYDFLREECGIEIARSLYSVHADLMRDEFAQLLGVDPQSPALVADELTFDRGNTPVLRGTLTYRADAYRFQANLLRPAR